MFKWWSILLLAIVLLPLLFLFVLGIRSWSQPELGLVDGKLKPCPSSPNCVCSQAAVDDSHYIEPLQYIEGTSDENRARLVEIINSQPRTDIITNEAGYLHATFTSALFRYTDDVEFQFDDEKRQIHLRSASRVGRSDLDANRKRIESIRALLTN